MMRKAKVMNLTKYLTILYKFHITDWIDFLLHGGGEEGGEEGGEGQGPGEPMDAACDL